ncbi:hypothetical protein Fmac_032608 [Flemingia macrophylla]|uniref:glucan endo-1,3-beta-D-glucosidase n=1 Tax=Flemingia macrophylla TaxID=520843 RepID=A0ABD1L5F9_9FABA
MAQNRSTALSWLYANIIPFYHRVSITTISIGNAFPDVYPTPSTTSSLPSPTSTSPSSTSASARSPSPPPPPSSSPSPPPSPPLLPSFTTPRRHPFRPPPPVPPRHQLLLLHQPLPLQPLSPPPRDPPRHCPLPRPPFNFHNDFTTGVRYRNLFDVMVDAVVSALALASYETLPVVVTETGRPSASSVANEFEANARYAEIYLRGLVKHLKSRMGTPMLREEVREVFVYEMFDRDEGSGSASANTSSILRCTR